jgi:hypothetical protein
VLDAVSGFWPNMNVGQAAAGILPDSFLTRHLKSLNRVDAQNDGGFVVVVVVVLTLSGFQGPHLLKVLTLACQRE